MNEHLLEPTFRATHEPHGALEVKDLPVKLPGDSKYIVIRCPACDKSITKLVGAEALLMAKQTTIPGTTHKAIAEIDHAAEAYVDIRDKRMKLTTKEVEAQATLVAAMQKHGLTAYRCASTDDPLDVTVVSTTKARVRSPKDESEDGGEDGTE